MYVVWRSQFSCELNKTLYLAMLYYWYVTASFWCNSTGNQGHFTLRDFHKIINYKKTALTIFSKFHILEQLNMLNIMYYVTFPEKSFEGYFILVNFNILCNISKPIRDIEKINLIRIVDLMKAENIYISNLFIGPTVFVF